MEHKVILVEVNTGNFRVKRMADCEQVYAELEGAIEQAPDNVIPFFPLKRLVDPPEAS